MKLLCLPIAFLYAVVKGQLASRTCLLAETLILTVEAGQRVFHGNYVTANFASLSSIRCEILATELKSSKS